MEDFSKITDQAGDQAIEKIRIPVKIEIHPYLMDHHFEGDMVLPAVEAIQVLAASVKKFRVDAHFSQMTRARFEKFLYIQPGIKQVKAYNDIELLGNGDVSATLLTKTRSKKTAITRIKEHARICFSQKSDTDQESPFNPPQPLEGRRFSIPAHRIYRDLVPFGPAYQNLKEILHFSENGIIVKIFAPEHNCKQTSPKSLGSPCPLDAAFHAACVWGQRFEKVVAFPVGFEKRQIFNPTKPGETYISHIIPMQTKAGVLIFDIWISDSHGHLFETAFGVQMKDASGGRLKPPRWIIANS